MTHVAAGIVRFRVRWSPAARAALERALADAGSGERLQPFIEIRLPLYRKLKASCRRRRISLSKLLSHTVLAQEANLRALCRMLFQKKP
jgi:hypothetical protein